MYTENSDWTCREAIGEVTEDYCEKIKCIHLKYNSMSNSPVCTKNYPSAKKRVNFIDVVTDYMEETGADFLADINGVLTPMYLKKD